MRWLVACAALGLFAFALDAHLTRMVLEGGTKVVTREGVEPSETRASPERRTAVLLPGALDAKWYVLHAADALNQGDWRVRHTDRDNAPSGREVHWSSAIVWLLLAIAHGLSVTMGGSPALRLQDAPTYFGYVSLALALLPIAWVVARRLGPAAAGMAVLVLATAFPFLDMFRPGETDHHGLAAAAAFLTAFCLAAGGAGMRCGRMSVSGSTRWFVASGVFGGAGLWLSASTLVPVIAGCALAGFLVSAFAPADPARCQSLAVAWRAWGISGGLVSLAFYLLEYFPANMGWRLEVNHPAYAAAWWGGARLVARAIEWISRWRGAYPDQSISAYNMVRLGGKGLDVLAIFFVALPAGMIIAGGERVFAVANPFLLELHSRYIREFASAWKAYEGTASLGKWVDALWWPSLALAGLALTARNRRVIGSEFWFGALFLCVVAVPLQVEALLQVRWLGTSTALWVASVVWIGSALLFAAKQNAVARWPIYVLAGFVFLGVLRSPLDTLRAYVARSGAEDAGVPKVLATSILLRDISHRIAESRDGGKVTVLSDPTSSTDLAFYGGLRVVGTLYWENLEGLLRAASMFAADSESEAFQLLRQANVDYVVVPSWDSFATFEAHRELLERVDPTVAAKGASYLASVLAGEKWPRWVRPIHYPIPEAFGLEESSVSILEIVPEQSEFEALRARGMFFFEQGKLHSALDALEGAQRLQPDDPDLARWIPALRKRVSLP